MSQIKNSVKNYLKFGAEENFLSLYTSGLRRTDVTYTEACIRFALIWSEPDEIFVGTTNRSCREV